MSSAEALLPTTRSPGTPTQAAQRRRLRPQGNYTYLLGLACVLLVAGSLLVMAVVHRRAGHALPGTPSAQALEDPSSETVAFPTADADTDDSDTDSDLDAGPAADDAGSLPPVSRRPSEQGMDEQSPQEMLTPLEVEAQPQVTSEYVLLGAPTTLCWKNGAKLEAVFPKSTTTHARPPLGQAPPEHLCTFSVGMDNITALQLLQRAHSIAPCNQPDGPPCTAGQLYSFRYAVHAAAHASLRYYMPPGSYNQAQLQHSLAMNPLLCGAQVYEYDLLPPQLQWSSQLLATVCPMFKSMLRLMGAVGAQGDTMDSRWDPTLPDVPGRFNPPVQDVGSSDRTAEAATAQLAARADAAAAKSPYYLLAFALYNAERVLPHYIVQVLSLVTYLPPGRVLVSCYESGSKDSTPGWLTFLQGMLDMLQIPSHIVIQGNMTRSGERIPFLAAVRNQALAPLYDPAAYMAAMERVGARPVSTVQGKQGKQSVAVFPADKIIYLNDPFFSWQDIMRLTLHNADLACGLDFQDNYGSLVPDVWPLTAEPVRRRALLGLQQHDASSSGGSDSSDSSLDRWRAVPVRVDSAALLSSLQGPRRKLRLHASWHALKDPINAFYDVWVARDMAGKPFYWVMPLVHDPHGLGLLTQGLPTPVQCCWNAAAVLNAAPFKPGGVPAGTAGAAGSKRDRLQFRSHGKGECAASECSLLCNDFWRTGFRKVLLDPSVRLSYLPYPRTYLHGTVMNGLPALTWINMQSKLKQQQVDLAVAREPPSAVMCCPIPPDLDYVEWEDCFMDTRWMDPPQLNGTALEAN